MLKLYQKVSQKATSEKYLSQKGSNYARIMLKIMSESDYARQVEIMPV